tara:strand:- start:7031 stop:7357 length:327 start_codon:yes stop_codon:yes gene_type:complete
MRNKMFLGGLVKAVAPTLIGGLFGSTGGKTSTGGGGRPATSFVDLAAPVIETGEVREARLSSLLQSQAGERERLAKLSERIVFDAYVSHLPKEKQEQEYNKIMKIVGN